MSIVQNNIIKDKSISGKIDEKNNIEKNIVIKAILDSSYRKDLIQNPKKILEQEFSKLLDKDVKFPENFEIEILEETENKAYIVLPKIINREVKSLDLSELDPDGGVAHYCTTVTCKPTFSC